MSGSGYFDIDNLTNLLEHRDLDTIGPSDPTFWGGGRGVVTTDEVRRALLGDVVHDEVPR